MKNKFYIRQYGGNQYLHGGVGYIDLEKTLEENGFERLEWPMRQEFSLFAKIKRLFYTLRLLKIPKNALIVFQFPSYSKLEVAGLRLLRLRSRNMIAHISDINGVKDGNQTLFKKEISFLRKFRCALVHNDSMKEKLQPHLPHTTLIAFDFFSFIALVNNNERKKEPVLCFAGNLSKSGFLSSVDTVLRKTNLTLHIYGEGGEGLQTEKILYQGTYAASELPPILQGSFGLIWDGDSTTSLKGPLGEYQRWISPHKLSLYVLAGLPIITHKDAASAAIVEKHAIGISVFSLEEIDEKIKALSEEDYQKMHQNCLRLAEKIQSGYFLLHALDEINR